ncbi:MAG: hypothetical protein PHF20_01325 [Halothiobacillaceae bacterium]|nr:hypothetical protein [Halothiobacillaceae bacterium]
MRRYVAYAEDSKVGIAVSDEHEDENSEDIGFSEHYFDDADELDKFVNEHPDMPDEIKEEAFALQKQILAERNSEQVVPTVGPMETKFAMLARHGELENMTAAGQKPNADYYRDLATKDAADFARLDSEGKKAVAEDMRRAAQASPEYAQGVEETGVFREEDKTLSGEDLEEVRRRLARDREDLDNPEKYSNQIDVKRTGSELEEDRFVKPTAIARDYEQVGLEYRMKSRDNLLFRESQNGNSLHTASAEKKIIGDMVILAKAKGWTSIKLSGTQDFRREAWLQAESQGIKTMGYTPKAADLEVLEALKQQRRENSIENLEAKEKVAPRTNVNSSEATLQTNAKLDVSAHVKALAAQSEFKGQDEAQLGRLAELRSLYAEDLKQSGKGDAEIESALKRFDQHVSDPERRAEFYKEADALQERKAPERKQQEHELSR